MFIVIGLNRLKLARIPTQFRVASAINFNDSSVQLKRIFTGHNDFEVKYLVCVTTVNVKNKIFAPLLQHAGTVKHEKNILKSN